MAQSFSNPEPADDAFIANNNKPFLIRVQITDYTVVDTTVSRFNVNGTWYSETPYAIDLWTAPSRAGKLLSGTNPSGLRYPVLQDDTKYEWYFEITETGGGGTFTSSTYTFTIGTPPASKATNPSPTDTAISVDFSNRTLSWTDGGGADTFDVYIGPQGNLALISSAQAGTSKVVDTEDIPWGVDIYWRIDSINAYGTTTGDTWSFSNVIVQGIGLGSAGDFIVAAAINGIYLSTDQGANWSRKTPDAVETTDWEKAICSSDGTYILVVSDANAIYRSANSGTVWAEITPAGGDIFAVSDLATSDDGQFMVIVGTNSTDATESCYISTDYGATWTAKKPVAASIAWTECDISNDGSIIAVCVVDYLYISLDSGATWLTQNLAAGAENWACLGISGDGTAGILTNLDTNDDVFLGVKTNLYSQPTWSESTITSAGRGFLNNTTQGAQQTTLGLGTGDSPTFTGLTLSAIVAEATDVDKFLVDSTGVIKYRTGAEVLSDIGASASAHVHNGATLQHDAVNSNGGAFSFVTTGLVTFNQNIAAANYTAANLLTAAATNAGELDFTIASKKLDVEDNAVVSQDYSSDASPTFAGLTVTNCAVLGSDSAVFQPNADSITFFQVLDADGGTSVFNVDSTNERVSINENTPIVALDIPAYNTSNSQLRIGSWEVQPYSLNNIFFTDNLYYNSGFKYRNTGYGGLLQFFNGEIRLSTSLSGIAGTDATLIQALTLKPDNKMGFYEASPETAVELTHISPCITRHCSTHINNLGRISKDIYKGEKLDGTEHTLAIVEVGHDGTGDDYDAYWKLSLNGTTGGIDTLVDVIKVDSDLLATFAGVVTTDEHYEVDGTQVISNQGVAVADATDAASVITQLNALLARCRTHGLIAT